MGNSEFPTKPRLSFWTLIVAAILFSLFVVWTAVYQVEELTRVPGTMEPRLGVAPIQIPQGGVIVDLPARNGQEVKAGDLLVRLEATGGVESVDSLTEQLAVLQAQKRRLQGLVQGRFPDLADFSKRYPDLARNQLQLYQNEMTAFRASLEVYRSQLNALGLSKAEREAELAGLRRQVNLLQEEKQIKENLAREGMSNRTELIALEREEQAVLSRLEQLPLTLQRMEEDVRQVEAKRAEYVQNLERDYARNLARIDEEIRVLQAQMDSSIRNRQLLEIRSPIDGLVNGLRKKRSGELARANEQIMEIIPEESAYLAVIRIPSTSMGYLQPGLSVQVTVDAYRNEPRARMSGTLEELSGSSLLDDSGKPYYEGTVRVDARQLSLERGKFPIISGMTINCAISTGKRSLLQYLLNTILQSYNDAFKER